MINSRLDTIWWIEWLDHDWRIYWMGCCDRIGFLDRIWCLDKIGCFARIGWLDRIGCLGEDGNMRYFIEAWVWGCSKGKHHHVFWYRNIGDMPRLLRTSRPLYQYYIGLTRNKHARIAPTSHMNLGRISVGTILGNPQAEKEKMKDLIKTVHLNCPIHSTPWYKRSWRLWGGNNPNHLEEIL